MPDSGATVQPHRRQCAGHRGTGGGDRPPPGERAVKDVFKKPDSFYEFFTRSAAADKEATHYCPGCGHGNLHKLIAEAIDDLAIAHRTVFVSPVGCAVFGYYYFRVGNVQAAHGRAPAVATGIKRALPHSIVISYQGDGDLAAIGANEILQAANRGESITVIFVNNAIYGMTGGQMAPTTLLGMKTTTTPYGRKSINEGYPLRVCELLATLEAPVYIERCTLEDSKTIMRTRKAIRKALEYQVENKGFSLVEVLSPCPTGWKLEPIESRQWITDNMVKVFPPNVYKDKPAEPREELPSPVFERDAVLNALGVTDEVASGSGHAPGDFPTHEVVLSGFGGQGVLLLGQLLAKSGMREGKYVSWLPSYGPEMRGGTANCHVVISSKRIGSPYVAEPNLLVAMNQPSLEKFAARVRPGGVVIYDSSFVKTVALPAHIRGVPIPLSEIANELGNAKVANVVAAGAIIALTGMVGETVFVELLRNLPKKALLEVNLKALAAGRQAAERQIKQPIPAALV
ncbi:MAG: 2-oxoacid:acceptor oxidoreductase family protein [candidate division Zixibacteria bacterium]|nr:2-oxoacid:acceptor oxidoreductase family protein [candidate division Zixibacteria bacterium]